MADLKSILETSLDDSNPDQWTDDGAPRLSVAQKLTGLTKLTRAEITATGRVRKMVSAAPAVAQLIDSGAALDAATIELQRAEHRVIAANADLKIKRTALATANTNWMAETPKLTQRDLIKAVSQRGPAPAAQAPDYQSPIDRILANGRGGSANTDWRRKPGRLIQPKLPSSR